jgi:hypothetical protein
MELGLDFAVSVEGIGDGVGAPPKFTVVPTKTVFDSSFRHLLIKAINSCP